MVQTAYRIPTSVENRKPDSLVRPVADPDPFRYGWRYVAVRSADGRETFRQVPLTWQDLLDPQLGDYMNEATTHEQLVSALTEMLRNHYLERPDIAVFRDLKMLWAIPGLPRPAPDVAVVPNVHDKGRGRKSFAVQREGTRPCLVIEVVSPEYSAKDYRDLPPIYERAGVKEYLIYDPGNTENDGPLKLIGYRLGATGRYRRIVPDSRGCLFSETTGLLFGADPKHRQVRIENAETGEQLLSAEQEHRARLRAERHSAEEAAARHETKNRAAEAQARAVEEHAARCKADAKAAKEAAARKAIEAELERLRGELTERDRQAEENKRG